MAAAIGKGEAEGLLDGGRPRGVGCCCLASEGWRGLAGWSGEGRDGGCAVARCVVVELVGGEMGPGAVRWA